MNGRAYDYNLGRFLSVDPFIQAPGNSQSMNPYSYIMNNPLSGTDPSGYSSECDSEAAASCPKKRNRAQNGLKSNIAMSNGIIRGTFVRTVSGSQADVDAEVADLMSQGYTLESGVNNADGTASAVLTKPGSISISGSTQGKKAGIMDYLSGYIKGLTQEFLDSQARSMASSFIHNADESIESSVRMDISEEEQEGADMARSFSAGVNNIAATVGLIANLRNGEFNPDRKLIQNSISLLVNDGAINLSQLSSYIPSSIENDFSPSDRISQGYKFNFKIGDTKVFIKWHSPDKYIRGKYPKSNSGRVWTAQIRVGRHYLLTNGTWSARKGVDKSNRAHIPIIR